MRDPEPRASSGGRVETDPAAARGGAARLLARSWRWVLLGGIVLAVRVSFPLLLAPLLAERLSLALGTRVEVGDLGIAPLDAILTLRNVRVHSTGGPAASPPVSAERVRVDVQWLPLLHRVVRVRDLALESATVEIDRRPDGGIALGGFAAADPAVVLPEGWGFEIDRVSLRGTRLRLRDPAAGDARAFEIDVRDAHVAGLRSRATAFGRAANLRMDARVGRGRWMSYGRYDIGPQGLALDVMTRLKDVPIDAAAAQFTEFGWASVEGRASGQVRWQREPGRREAFTGRINVQRLAVRVDGEEEPALRVRRAVVDIDGIDAGERRLALGALELRGATLAVRADADDPVPLLARVARPATRARPMPRGRAAAAAATDSPRWIWAVKRFDTPDGHLRILSGDGPLDFRARVSGENLGQRAYFSPLSVRLRGDEGEATFEGTARFGDGIAAEGRLVVAGVPLRDLARAADLPGAALVESGRLAGELALAVDTTAGDAQPIDVRGPVQVADLSLAAGEPGVFSAGAAALSATLDGIELRGWGAEPAARSALRLVDVAVAEPWLLLTRSEEGWLLPGRAPAAAPDGHPDAASPEPTTLAAAPAPAGGSAPVAAPGADGPRLELSRVSARAGRILVVDRVPSPPVTLDVAQATASVRELLLPADGLDGLDGLAVAGRDPALGDLDLSFHGAGSRRVVDATARGGLLSAATPYLERAGLPLRFVGGRGTVAAHVVFGGDRWSAEADLDLVDPQIGGSVRAIEDALATELPIALAALRDPSGTMSIHLDVSSTDDLAGAAFGEKLAAAVRAGIRRLAERPAVPAADGAASPGDSAAAGPPPSAAGEGRRLVEAGRFELRFEPGRAEFAGGATGALAEVGELLAQRPWLVVNLAASTTAEDRRWLAEQDLLRRLSRPDALRGMLRVFGVGAARERIRAALERRAVGEPGLLDEADEAELREYLAESPPLSPMALADLRQARIERVVLGLGEYHGVSRRRLRADIGEAAGSGWSAVRVVLLAPAEAPGGGRRGGQGAAR